VGERAGGRRRRLAAGRTDLIGDDVIAMFAVGRQTAADRLHYKATSYTRHWRLRPAACKLIPGGRKYTTAVCRYIVALPASSLRRPSQPMLAVVFARFCSVFSVFL